ncbi:MAG: Fur family transcriptional regulator [Azospirillaceae bacterium]
MTETTDRRPYRHLVMRLQQAGLRPTRQRLALGRLLFGETDRHVTAEQLYEEATAARSAVSLATVYNTLNQFTAAGLLREVVVEPGRSYFDTNVEAHHHFYHPGRGELTDISDADIRIENLPEAPAGSRIQRVDVVVRLADGDG